MDSVAPCRSPWRCSERWRRGPQRISTRPRSEEHTSELQSQSNLVCRLLLEKKKHYAVLRWGPRRPRSPTCRPHPPPWSGPTGLCCGADRRCVLYRPDELVGAHILFIASVGG